MSEQLEFNLIVNDLSKLGLVLDVTSNRSFKEVLKRVSHDKHLYKRVCDAKKSYQREKQHTPEADILLETLEVQMDNIFKKWEQHEI